MHNIKHQINPNLSYVFTDGSSASQFGSQQYMGAFIARSLTE